MLAKRRMVIVPVIAIAAIAVMIYFVWKNTSGRARQDEISGSGTIEVTEVDISSKISGKIEEIKVSESGRVEKDDLLAVLAHNELNAQLEQAQASYLAATEQFRQVEAQFANAKDNYARAQDLLKSGSYSKQQFDSAETQFKVVSRQLDAGKQLLNQANAQVSFVKSQIDNAYLRSPIAGIVLQKNAEVGEISSPGSAILTIGDLTKPWLKIYLSTIQVGRIKLGNRASVKVDAFPDKAFEGKVTNISSEAEFTPKNVQTKEERTRLVYAVKISIENKDGQLKPGMPADAEIDAKNN